MDKTWIRQLAAITARAPSADNSQPWELRWTGDSLRIQFAERTIKNGVFGASSHATLLSIGALIDHLRAALEANESAADLVWPAQPELGRPYVTQQLAANMRDFIEAPALLARHTNRGPFLSAPLPSELVGQLVQGKYGSARVVLISNHQKKSALIRLTRLSSEARFCSQRLHEWLIASLRYTPEEVATGEGLDVRALCLPPGGRQFLRFTADWGRLNALNRVGAYKLLAFSEVGLLAAAPALVCIVGGTDTRDVMAAGQLLSQVWIDLNVKGIAVHPYYVIADQINRLHDGSLAQGFNTQIKAVETELRQLIDLAPNEQLHMMLRIGQPKLTPVRSRRFPLHTVFVDETHG